jgi:uncharacterized protein YndB with AHSA1/START domain
MRKGTRGEASRHIATPPALLYDLVSDVTRMGQWSPECVRCEWLDEATGPAAGARFKGTNKRGVVRWSTTARVLAAERGREFTFVTGHRGHDETRWTYRFEPEGDGTRVTETFEMLADLPWYLRVVERVVMRVKDRKADLELGMAETLRRLAIAAEGASAGGTTALESQEA